MEPAPVEGSDITANPQARTARAQGYIGSTVTRAYSRASRASYSSWWPIQNQTTVLPSREHTAR